MVTSLFLLALRPTAFGDEGAHVAIGSKGLQQYTLTLGRFNLIKNLD
jgi:hypothetical protein